MAANPKMITLRSSDNENFDVEEAVMLEFGTFKLLLEDGWVANTVPVPNVTGTVLAKVIEYCKKHVEAAAAKSDADELKKWDAEFVKVDQNTLFELISAANYLNVKSLLDLTCQIVADMITGKTPEDMRKFFNIENDYSPEEEEKVRKENLWAFE